MAAAANRDSSPPLEDDGSLSVTAGLAKEAALLFQTAKYADCLTVLNQILQRKEGDPKILHNIAIAESFQDGCTDPRRLLEILLNVQKRSEELAYASAEHVEAVGNLGKAMIGTNTMSSGSSSPMVYNDEFDTSVTMFNIAVTWFHLHEYDKAFLTLESLYKNIQPIDEGTALRICLLFLDVALFTHHTTRAADFYVGICLANIQIYAAAVHWKNVLWPIVCILCALSLNYMSSNVLHKIREKLDSNILRLSRSIMSLNRDSAC